MCTPGVDPCGEQPTLSVGETKSGDLRDMLRQLVEVSILERGVERASFGCTCVERASFGCTCVERASFGCACFERVSFDRALLVRAWPIDGAPLEDAPFAFVSLRSLGALVDHARLRQRRSLSPDASAFWDADGKLGAGSSATREGSILKPFTLSSSP